MLVRLFRRAGATGHVFLLKSGRVEDKGIAYSGLIGPATTVAVVPSVPQIIDFVVEARTKDNQVISVSGNLKVTLKAEMAVKNFDFTVNVKDGAYTNMWERALQALVTEQVFSPIRDKAKEILIAEALSSHMVFEDAVKAKVSTENNPLAHKGVLFDSSSIAAIEALDEEVDEAIGAQERQKMLTEADRAVHQRRLKASANDRAVATYEAKTKLGLEKERGLLLEEQGKNDVKRSEDEAKATEIRLAPLSTVDAGKVLGAALMKMAESGRIGNLAIGPELLAALQQK